MDVGVGQSLHDRRDFSSSRAHFDQHTIECVTHFERDGGRACPGDHDARLGRRGRRGRDVRRGERDPLCRQRNRAGDEIAGLPQCYVHCPVVTTEFRELARAVERIDDPHPFRAQPDGVIGTLLGQHRVIGPRRCESLHQEIMRALVSRSFSLGSTGIGELLADTKEQFPRLGRQSPGDLVVSPIGHWRVSSSSTTRSASSSGERSGVSRRSGFFGRWYGLSIPVKWVISPARALAYKPFGSRRSQSSSGVSQNTSKKSRPLSFVTFRASARCSSRGLIAGTSTIWPESARMAAIWASLRWFSARSAMEKPRSAFSPCRRLSPSKTYAGVPFSSSFCSTSIATDDLPDPDSPVNQTVLPFDSRSSEVHSESCRTVLGLPVPAAQKGRIIPAATVPLVFGSIRMNEPVAALRLYSSSSSGTWVRNEIRPSSLSLSAVAVLSRCRVLTSRR